MTRMLLLKKEKAKTSVNEALTNAKNAVRNATTNQLVETVLTSNSNNISQNFNACDC